MTLFSSLRRLLRNSLPLNRKSGRRAVRPWCLLNIEALEERALLTAPDPFTQAFNTGNNVSQFGGGNAITGEHLFAGDSFNNSVTVGSIDHEAVGDFGLQAGLSINGKAGVEFGYSVNSGTVNAQYDATVNQNYSEPTNLIQTVSFKPDNTFVRYNAGAFSTATPSFDSSANVILQLHGTVSGTAAFFDSVSGSQSFDLNVSVPLYSIDTRTGVLKLMGIPLDEGIGGGLSTAVFQKLLDKAFAVPLSGGGPPYAWLQTQMGLHASDTDPTLAATLGVAVTATPVNAQLADSLSLAQKLLEKLKGVPKIYSELGSASLHIPTLDLSSQNLQPDGSLNAAGSDRLADLLVQMGTLCLAGLGTTTTFSIGPAKIAVTPISFQFGPTLSLAQTASVIPDSTLTYSFDHDIDIALNGTLKHDVKEITFDPNADSLDVSYDGTPITVTPKWNFGLQMSNNLKLTTGLSGLLTVGQFSASAGPFSLNPPAVYQKDFGKEIGQLTLATPYNGTFSILNQAVDLPQFTIGDTLHPDTIVTTTADTGQTATTNSLRFAVDSANVLASQGQSTTVINLGAGTYHLTDSTLGSLKVGDGTNLTIIGAGADQTIIDATGLGTSAIRVKTGGHLNLVGVTIRGGNSADYGGGIYAESGSYLKVQKSVISGNTANSGGGGIYGVSPASLSVIESTISSNTVTSGDGGGLYVEGGASRVVNSAIRDNTASVGGGGIRAKGGASLEVIQTTVSGNSAQAGAGLRTLSGLFEAHPSVTLVSSTFSDNKATGQTGSSGQAGATGKGGAASVESGTVKAINSTFSGNQATGGRGGDSAYPGTDGANGATSYGGRGGASATLSATQSLGGGGGGGAGLGGSFYVDTGATATLLNSTLANNMAQGGAGGKGASVSIFGLIKTSGNGSAGQGAGGGIYVNEVRIGSLLISGGTADVGNTIIAGNSANVGNDLQGGISSRGHNLFGNSSGVSGLDSTDLKDVDAKLNVLADNGGPTKTLLPQAGSPAIDAGALLTPAIGIDQRGFVRRGTVDIGAVENQYDLAVFATETASTLGTREYTFLVVNQGPEAAGNVQLAVTLPSGLAFSSAVPSSTFTVAKPAVGQSGVVTFTRADGMAAGELAKQKVKFIVTNSTNSIAPTATLSPTAGDSNPENNSVTLARPQMIEGLTSKTLPVLFHFDDPASFVNANSFFASVLWGDGSRNDSSDGTGTVQVAANANGGYDVVGSHAYSTQGAYTANVTVSGGGGGTRLGLIHEYRGEDGVIDSAGTTDGVVTGAVTSVVGQAGNGFQFDGTGGRIQLPALTVGASDFSIELWIKTTSTRSEAILSNRLNGLNGNFFALRTSQGRLLVEMEQDNLATNHHSLSTTAVVNDGQFHHVVIVRQGNKLSFYVDGKLDGSPTLSSITNLTNSKPLWLGWQTTAGGLGLVTQPFTGVLDEIGIYNRALRGGEVAARFTATQGGLFAGGIASVTVADAPLVAGQVTPPAAYLNVPTSPAVLFHFNDTNPRGVATDFTATVLWGDSTSNTSADGSGKVSIVASAEGGFDVIGAHTYTKLVKGGTFRVKIASEDGVERLNRTAPLAVTRAALGISGRDVSAIRSTTLSSAIVAGFADFSGAQDASFYKATIRWGDDSPSTSGTIEQLSGTTLFVVKGSHQYSKPGTYTISVIAEGTNIVESSLATSAATVQNDVAISGTPVAAVEGQNFTGEVATFTDLSPAASVSSYSATIDWGNQTSTGTISVDANGVYRVTGTHSYPSYGSYPIQVTIREMGGYDRSQGQGVATVADAPLTGSGKALSAVEGTTFSGIVATIFDANGNGAAADLLATIDWADGQTSAGVITKVGQAFNVSGSHVFTKAGTLGIRVTVTSSGGSRAFADGVVQVADAPLTVTGTTVEAVQGQAFTGVAATFTDSNTASVAGDFSALINWGDGQTSNGTITANSNGGFNVNGSHTFATPGTFAVTSTVTDARAFAVNSGNVADLGAFVADYSVSHGQVASRDAAVDVSGVANAAPAAVYQTERYGNFAYILPGLTPGASYTVRLHFAEIHWDAAGQRLFNVAINGTQVLTNFDVLATAGGKNKAVVRDFTATADSDGVIAIQYTAVVDNAKSSGIELLQAGTRLLAINSGGVGTSSSFAPDTGFNTGSYFTTSDAIDTSGVANAAPVAVYQSERYGNFSYTVPNLTAGALYDVRLHFAEIYWTEAGKRVFNVAVNGTPVLANFDIFATAGGKDKAVVKDILANASAEGSITITYTTVVDNAKSSGIEVLRGYQGTSAARVSDLVVTGVNFSITEGSAFSGTVATFTDLQPESSITSYKATIDWGDGTISIGTVTANANGGYNVSGTHTYRKFGSYAVKVTATEDNSITNAYAQSTATVANAAITATGKTLLLTEGRPFSTSIATFTDANPLAVTSDFTASIDWGDGTTSAGSVVIVIGGFAVNGSHTYADDGVYTMTVTIQDGAATTVRSTGNVADVVPSVTVDAGSSSLVGQVRHVNLTVTDPGTADQAAGYSYSISWGDGNSDTVSRTSNNGMLTKDHTYQTSGNFAVKVTATDSKGMVSSPAITNAQVTTVTSAALQTVLNSISKISFTPTSTAEVSSVLNVANSLSQPATPVSVSVNFNAGTHPDVVATSSSNVKLVLKGSSSFGSRIQGHSPAITIESGDVEISDFIIETDTDSPTILVLGGHLKVRNCIIEESAGAGCGFAGIQVLGGSADLGTADDPGFNTIEVNGPGMLIDNQGANAFSAIGNTYLRDGSTLSNPFQIEDLITDGLDTPGLGLVRLAQDQVYVSAQGGDIQRAINLSTAGDTIHLQAGTYANYVAGSTPVTITFENGPSIALQEDSIYAGLTSLAVSTQGSTPTLTGGSNLSVAFSGLPTGVFAPTGRVLVDGQLVAPTATLTNGGPVQEALSVRVSFSSMTDLSPVEMAAGFRYSFDFDDDGVFDVVDSASPIASITFTSAGAHTIHGRIANQDGAFTDYETTVTVTDAPLTATGTSITAVEGDVPVDAIMATFSDANPYSVAGNFTASIAWGDGQTSAGSVSLGDDGLFAVHGSHSYAQAGSYTFTVTIDDLGGSTTAQGLATIADAPLSALGATLRAPNGSTFTGIVATFTDANPFGKAGDFSATIAWGDGQSSCGAISQNEDGSFSVIGTTTYTTGGSYTAHVTIGDQGGSSTSTDSTVNVAFLTSASIHVTATEGAEVSTRIASFTDIDPDATAGNYTASINWGDGNTSTGVISGNVAQGFAVSGSHTYVSASTYIAHVSISSTSSGISTTDSTVEVADAALTSIGTTIDATEGTALSTVLAHFADANRFSKADDFTAILHWGDGRTSDGIITADSTGGYLVAGSHTYEDAARFEITVIVADVAGANTTASSQAIVADPSVIATGGFTMPGVEGSESDVSTVATFTDPGGPEVLADYAATINWGDGQLSAGTITKVNDLYSVSGSHPYAEVGAYPITVTIQHGAAVPTTANSAATITNAAPIVVAAGSQTTTTGAVTAFALGSFNDLGLADGPWSVTVSWGDGSANSMLNVTTQGDLPSQYHAYTATGTYPVTFQLADKLGASAVGRFNVTVTPAKTVISVTSSLQSTVYGQAVSFVAAVTVPAPSAGTPTGMIQFVIDGTALSSPVTLSVKDGVAQAASVVIPTLQAGVHSIQALYSGDSNFEASDGTLYGGQSVTPAPLTIRADDQSMVYGGSMPSLTATLTGLVNGDKAAAIHGLTLSTAAATSHAGSYSIMGGGAVNPNYTISYLPGTLAITSANLTITADNKSLVYEGRLPTLTASYSGFVNGDTSASLTMLPSLTTSAAPTGHVGSYRITASDAVDLDYTISYVSGTLTITPASLTIKADNQGMTYAGSVPTLTAWYQGFVNGDTSADLTTQPTLSTPATAHSSVGKYTVSASGAVDADYRISYVDGALSVTPALLTVTATNASKVYGSANPVIADTITGFVNGDDPSVVQGNASLTTAATAASEVGSYSIKAAQGSLSAVNYDFAFIDGMLMVTKAALRVAVADASKVYGQDISSALTGSITGIQNGDSISASYSSAGAVANAALGKYAIDSLMSDLGTGKLARDYEVTIVPGMLSVNADTTTTQVKSSSNASNYGQAVTFTATVTANAPGSGTPTGTVTFYDGTTILGTATLNGGVATLTTTATGLAAGDHSISAHYNGDANFTTGISAVLRQSVLSAQQQATVMIGNVTGLVNSGVLTSSEGNALSSKLHNAITNLIGGNATAGINQLKAFINQVKAFVNSRRLTTAQAQLLIDAADQAIASAQA